MTAPDLARFAALLADGTRACFCVALLDGRAWTAGELARSAGVAASTASQHITQLIAGGVLAERRQGRHRYVQIADTRTAELIEIMAAHAPVVIPRPASLRAATMATALANGRTCYDHFAGRLGVRITTAMVDAGLLGTEQGYTVTPVGVDWLRGLGIDVDGLRRARRPFVRECLDWTERLSHVAGGVGAAVCRRFFDAGWVTRTGSGRAVRLTASGRTALRDHLGIHDAVPEAPGSECRAMPDSGCQASGER